MHNKQGKQLFHILVEHAPSVVVVLAPTPINVVASRTRYTNTYSLAHVAWKDGDNLFLTLKRRILGKQFQMNKIMHMKYLPVKSMYN